MNDQGYIYHGDDGDLTSWAANFTSRNGEGGGNHEEDFFAAMRLAAACKAGGAFLDVGSGVGRIIEKIRADAGTVTGLEPDRQRYETCRDGFAADSRVEMVNSTSWDYRRSRPRRRFDFITVSMVLQHVSTRTCQNILCDVRELLAPKAVALLATTHFSEERFTYEADPSPHETGEFDRYADQAEDQDRGIPVRMFSKESLHRAIESAGLEVIAWRQFSYVRPERLDWMASTYRVPGDQIRDLGMSQYAVVRRPAPTAPRRGVLGWLRD